jgi:hypothetical protein
MQTITDHFNCSEKICDFFFFFFGISRIVYINNFSLDLYFSFRNWKLLGPLQCDSLVILLFMLETHSHFKKSYLILSVSFYIPPIVAYYMCIFFL